mgnify:CR=1 FL=1
MSSRGLNVCTLAGNVAATPELKTIPSGAELAEFTIYVNRVPARKENDSFTSTETAKKRISFRRTFRSIHHI